MNKLYDVFAHFWNNVTKPEDDKRIAGLSLPEGIKEVCNIPYTDSGSEYHRLDVYYPENAEGPLPVIIEIHGGGWMYGTKDLNKIYAQYLAKRGFVVFNLSYRLVPEVFVPSQLQDVAQAISKVKELMTQFPCDTSRIILTGDSAGGQLACFTAAISRSEILRNYFDTADHGIDFSCLVLTSPVAYMNDSLPMGLYCRMMWGENGHKKSTRRYMNADELIREAASFPPTILTTSSGDSLALAQTRRLYKTLLENGIEAQLLDFPKFEGKHLPHVFSVLEPYNKAGTLCNDKVCEFINKHI